MNVLVRDDNAPVSIHPPGFRVSDHRKAIPLSVKFDAILRWNGKCAACGEKLQAWTDTQFDHDPALESRPWNPEASDFIPPQLDPLWIAPKHRDCHSVKTNGRGGEKRICSAGSDQGNAGKIRRITKAQLEFRAKLLAKGEEPAPEDDRREKRDRPRPKPKMPSRPFPKGRKFAKATSSKTHGVRQ